MQRVLLADNHPVTRSGIRSLISKVFPSALFDEVENRTSVNDALSKNAYDLIVLDIAVAGFNFPGDLASVLKSAGDARLLVFSANSEDLFALRCLKMGASGYLHKTATETEILQAIVRVLSGRKYYSAALADQVAGLAVNDLHMNPLDALSDRELEIASLINEGLSLPEIAKQLSLGYSTCNTYKRRIFEKLNIQNIFSLTRLLQRYSNAS